MLPISPHHVYKPPLTVIFKVRGESLGTVLYVTAHAATMGPEGREGEQTPVIFTSVTAGYK